MRSGSAPQPLRVRPSERCALYPGSHRTCPPVFRVFRAPSRRCRCFRVHSSIRPGPAIANYILITIKMYHHMVFAYFTARRIPLRPRPHDSLERSARVRPPVPPSWRRRLPSAWPSDTRRHAAARDRRNRSRSKLQTRLILAHAIQSHVGWRETRRPSRDTSESCGHRLKTQEWDSEISRMVWRRPLSARMCLTSSAAQFHYGTKINTTVPRCPYSMSLIAPRVTAPSDASVATE